jgi:hypothetical protein
MRLLRWLCEALGHPGSAWLSDVTNEFVIQDCVRCRTVVITALSDDNIQEDYEEVLDRWLMG